MANAKRDQNRTPTLLGVSSVDGITPTLVKVNPANGAMLIDSASLQNGLDTIYFRLDATNSPITGATTISPSSDVLPLTVVRPTSGTKDIIQIQNTAGASRISFQLGNENDSRLALNRNGDSNEVRLSLLSAGAVRGQWRLDSSNNMIFQRATGSAGSEVFTNSFRVMNATGNVNVAGTLSFGATTEDILLSRASATRLTCDQDFNVLSRIRIGTNGTPSDTLDVDGTTKLRTTATGDITLAMQASSGQTGNFVTITSSGGSTLATINVSGDADFKAYSIAGTPGVSGTFTTTDGKTVTVTGGLITSII